MDKFPGYERYQTELKMARTARLAGNEGKARVRARRAAGIVVGEYLKQNGYPLSDPSAYALLKYFHSLHEVPEEIRQVAEHFLLRVDKDQNLPVPVDLIAEAAWLENTLLSR